MYIIIKGNIDPLFSEDKFYIQPEASFHSMESKSGELYMFSCMPSTEVAYVSLNAYFLLNTVILDR